MMSSHCIGGEEDDVLDVVAIEVIFDAIEESVDGPSSRIECLPPSQLCYRDFVQCLTCEACRNHIEDRIDEIEPATKVNFQSLLECGASQAALDLEEVRKVRDILASIQPAFPKLLIFPVALNLREHVGGNGKKLLGDPKSVGVA